MRSWLAAGLLTPLLVAGCIGGPGNAADGWFRNESSEPVAISIDQPGHELFGGTLSTVIELPPWQKGWCYADGYGINAGSVTIAVTGSLLPAPASETISVPVTPPSFVGVLVGASGVVHFTSAPPKSDKGACQGYRELFPTSSP